MAKYVFGNSQLAHVWANQSQDSGRNSTGQMYFSGTQIWSYGSHYLLGQIHTNKKGQKYALLNSHGYSMSTMKQRGHCVSALIGLMPFYYAESPGCPKTAVLESTNTLIDRTFDNFKSIKVWSDNIESTLDMYQKHNELCDLTGHQKDKLVFTEDLQDLYKEHYALRKKRELELNTPEALAKKEAQRVRKEELASKKQALAMATDIQKFKDFETNQVRGLSPQIIRVKENTVQTSGGADVPLKDALRLLEAVESGTVKPGMTVGLFSYDSLDSDIVKIGCHRISLSHAKSVLKPNPLAVELEAYLNQNVAFRDYEILDASLFGTVAKSAVHQKVDRDSIEYDVQNALQNFHRDGFSSICFYVEGV